MVNASSSLLFISPWTLGIFRSSLNWIKYTNLQDKNRQFQFTCCWKRELISVEAVLGVKHPKDCYYRY